jgi:hypothetical protein
MSQRYPGFPYERNQARRAGDWDPCAPPWKNNDTSMYYDNKRENKNTQRQFEAKV